MDAPVEVRADDVTLDARQRDLELTGDVRIDAPPFHLRSDRLRVQRGSLGVKVEGQGKLGFCPCLGTPLAVAFDGATVAPPGDVLVRSPRLELFGLPVLAAPVFWLRSPGRAGLLPPDLAYRAEDGLFLGVGAHVPWRDGDAERGMNARVGAYVRGGLAAELAVRAPLGVTRVRVDHLDRTGLEVDARGGTAVEGALATARARGGERGQEGAARRAGTELAADGASARVEGAWDVDVVRGARGVLATTGLDAAARPYDRANAEIVARDGSAAVAVLVRSVSARGGELGDLGAAGPALRARASGALGGALVWDATAEGATLSRPGGGAVTRAHGDGGFGWAAHAGPFGLFGEGRGAVETGTDAAAEGSRRATAGTASARATLSLPLARAYASEAPEAGVWVHRTEPRASLGALVARGEPLLDVRPGRGAGAAAGDAWIAEAGWANVLGNLTGGTGAELLVSGGVVGDARETVPAVRARAAIDGGWLGLGADYARVLTPTFGLSGEAGAVRLRIGHRQGIHVGALLAGLRDLDPTRARLLAEPTLDPASPFLASPGTTVGGRARVPWSRAVATSGGVDVDPGAPALLAARATVELRDRCDCLVLRANGAHRAGRAGVDVWLTLEIAAR